MTKNRGFTLVELLVVMAIIAILSAIVVPNVAKYISQARANRAHAEIASMELAITSMVSTADRAYLRDLFDLREINRLLRLNNYVDSNGLVTQDGFEALQELFTRTTYALLRQGRATLNDYDMDIRDSFPTFGDGGGGDFLYSYILNNDVVQRLGSSYLPDISFDPWGENLYQVFPGPWPLSFPAGDDFPELSLAQRVPNGDGTVQDLLPIPFRTYIITEAEQNNLPGQRRASSRPDGYTISVYDPVVGTDVRVGYPATREKDIFIWSYGGNLINGQPFYRPVDENNIYRQQEEEYMGGGDDVNNWDNGRSWMRFYG